MTSPTRRKPHLVKTRVRFRARVYPDRANLAVAESVGDQGSCRFCGVSLALIIGSDAIGNLAISEFPKWRKYLISLCFRGKSSVRPVQVGGFDVNIVTHRRGGPVRYHAWPPPWEPSCRTRTGPLWKLTAPWTQNAPTAPWKTLCVFHKLPQGLSCQFTHEKPRKAPKWHWETRIDPAISTTPSAVGGPLKPQLPSTASRARCSKVNPCSHGSDEVAD